MNLGIARQAAEARAMADIAAAELAGLSAEQIEAIGFVAEFGEELEREAQALEAVADVLWGLTGTDRSC